MASQYPAQIDNIITLPLAVDNLTPVNGSLVNRLREAIVRVEAELGVKPSGIYTTVRNRLDQLEAIIFGIDGAGAVISSGTALPGQALIWNGTSWHPSTDFLEQPIITVGSLTSGPALSASQTTGIIVLNGKFVVNSLESVSVSGPNQGVFYYDGYYNKFRISENGGPYGDLGSFTANGDLSGTSTSQTVIGIYDRPVSSTAPEVGQALAWDGYVWIPTTIEGGGGSLQLLTFSKTSPNGGTLLYRRGDTLATLAASATYESGPPTSGSISNSYGGSTEGGDIDLGAWTFTTPFATGTAAGTVKRSGSDLGANPTFTASISVTKGSITRNSSFTVTWGSDVYYGVGVAGLSTEADIEGLAGTALATSRNRTITVSPSSQKVYYAYPKGYGTATFTLNGFPAAFNAPSEVSVTNINGVTRTYYLYESTNLLTGSGLNFVVT